MIDTLPRAWPATVRGNPLGNPTHDTFAFVAHHCCEKSLASGCERKATLAKVTDWLLPL